MPFAAVLDASVLYPLPLRDTLLRVAESELFIPYWSEQILSEVTRNLIDDGRATPVQARNLTNAMREAFDAATITEDVIAQLEPAMTNDPKDRHVLAAAVASDAHAVVTLNLEHFPVAACDAVGVEPLSPDVFLIEMYRLDEDAVRAALERQRAALRSPPLQLNQLLDRLAVTVPRFATMVRSAT